MDTTNPVPMSPEEEAREQIRQSLVSVPMSPDELGEWKTRVTASEARVKTREKEWDILLDQYNPCVSDEASAGDVKSNTHYRNTHTKIGQLFVRDPRVTLLPKGPANDVTPMPNPMGPMAPPIPAQPSDAIATRQAVLRYFLGPDEINVIALMDECLMDMQVYSGFSAVLCEYRSTTRMVTQPVMGPDPNFQPNPLSVVPQPAPQVPQTDPLTGKPLTEQVPVVIHEQWLATRLSPKCVLFDDQLRSPQHQRKSRWIGHRAKMSKRIAMRQFGISSEEADAGAVAADDDRIHPYDDDKTGDKSSAKDQLWYTEIWYRAIHFRDDELHPEKLMHLILFDCVADRPVVHEAYKHQKFDAQGQLVRGSLRWFPIKVGSLRVAIDSPFPKADAAFTHALVLQINTFLQQSVKLRDAAIGKYFYDTDAITPDDLPKLTGGEVGATVGLKAGALAQGAEKIFYTTAQVRATADDWRTMSLLKSYMDETLGISSTQAGAATDTVRSATEINAVGASAAGRQEKERSRVIEFFLEIAREIDMLVWMYAIGDRWVPLLGPTGTQKLVKWNRTLSSGEFMYDIQPDSQLAIDTARDRQQKIAGYNVMGPDPLFRRSVALRDLARLFGWDPVEAVVSEAEAQMTIAAQARGLPAGQPPHGGGPINKHVQEQSGGTQNAPGAPGNNRQERNPPPPGQSPRPMP